MSFERWIIELDSLRLSSFGLSIYELPDMLFRDEYDAGLSSEQFMEEHIPDLNALDGRSGRGEQGEGAACRTSKVVPTPFRQFPTASQESTNAATGSVLDLSRQARVRVVAVQPVRA